MFDVATNTETRQNHDEIRSLRQRPDSLRAAHQKYVDRKTANEKNPTLAQAEQNRILDRVAEFTQTGIAELAIQQEQLFTPFSKINVQLSEKHIDLWNTDFDARSEAQSPITKEILKPTFDPLLGQEHKLRRAAQYITEMLSAVQSLIDQYSSIEGNEQAKKDATEVLKYI